MKMDKGENCQRRVVMNFDISPVIMFYLYQKSLNLHSFKVEPCTSIVFVSFSWNRYRFLSFNFLILFYRRSQLELWVTLFQGGGMFLRTFIKN